jgi:hypothetical protein
MLAIMQDLPLPRTESFCVTWPQQHMADQQQQVLVQELLLLLQVWQG